MLKQVYSILAFTLMVILSGNAQTVQAGLTSSGTNLIISAKPDQAINVTFAAGNVTITWPNSYGVTLGSITNTVGTWTLNDNGTSGGTDYANFACINAPAPTINWGSGSTNELFSVAVNQRDAIPYMGDFTLSNNIPDAGGNWYFETGAGSFKETF